MNQVDESIHNFENFKMVLDKNDVDISKQIRDNGWYTDEKLETDVFQSHLKKGMTFWSFILLILVLFRHLPPFHKIVSYLNWS